MAIGADRGILLKTDGTDWDAQSTAAAIVEAIRGEEPFDLILFGNESADTGNYQVGIRVAHALGLPVVNGLKKIELQDGNVRCERDTGGARDVYVVPTPAVLSVLEGLNLPRYPSVPGRLRAKSKPLAVSEPVRPEQKLEKLRLVVPPGQGKQAEILGRPGPEARPGGDTGTRPGGRA
jgi:electron transfer flavoprotein beta subunit